MPDSSAPPPAGAGQLSRRDLLRSAGLGAGALLLAACGGTAATTGNRTNGDPAIAVTDQRGERVTLDGSAHRVVTIPMPAASILIAVDQGIDHLVGMHRFSWLAIRDGILGEIFPEALHIAYGVAGNDFAPNVESIVTLHPDLVVQWGDNGAGIIAPLENAGLTVLGLTYGDQQAVDTWLRQFATLLGKRQRGEEMVARIHDDLTRMKAIGAQAPGPKPSVLYFNRFSGGRKVAGKGTYNDFYIKMVGATNPATGDRPAPGAGMVGVDIEQVLAWDPDIVLLGNFDDAVPDDVYGSAVWQHTRAVRNRRVYKVPLGGYRWDPPSHESPLMWHWLSMVAFPGGHRFDLRNEIKDSYRFCYDYEPDDGQIDKILQTDLNAQSAHYGRFRAA